MFSSLTCAVHPAEDSPWTCENAVPACHHKIPLTCGASVQHAECQEWNLTAPARACSVSIQNRLHQAYTNSRHQELVKNKIMSMKFCEVLTLRFYKPKCVQNMRTLTLTSTARFASVSLEIVKYQGTRDSRWLNLALTLLFVEFRCRTQSSRISDKSSPWRHDHKNKRYENRPGLKAHSHGYYKWRMHF